MNFNWTLIFLLVFAYQIYHYHSAVFYIGRVIIARGGCLYDDTDRPNMPFDPEALDRLSD